MQKGSIFSDISPAEWERILHCFQPITQKFEAGSYIMTFSEDLGRIGIMLSGKAHLYRRRRKIHHSGAAIH